LLADPNTHAISRTRVEVLLSAALVAIVAALGALLAFAG
jgi:hypothetical protein